MSEEYDTEHPERSMNPNEVEEMIIYDDKAIMKREVLQAISSRKGIPHHLTSIDYISTLTATDPHLANVLTHVHNTRSKMLIFSAYARKGVTVVDYSW